MLALLQTFVPVKLNVGVNNIMRGTIYISTTTLYLLLSEAVKKEGLNKFCKKHNLGPVCVSNMLTHRRPLSEDVIQAIGYKRVTVYQKIPVKKEAPPTDIET